MEKVLRDSNDGVVVFVSPLKVLVNQVIGDVVTRMDKKYPKNCNTKMYGRFTNDSEKDVLNCQILVTLPRNLERLLFSQNEEMYKWRKRIQYVIFDEVHEISTNLFYKRIMSCLNCPVIALSATINKPKIFLNWLNEVENNKPLTKMQKKAGFQPQDRKVHLVKEYKKISDVKYFTTCFDNDLKLVGLKFDLFNKQGEVHSLAIYNALKQHCYQTYKDDLDKLEPSVFFSSEVDLKANCLFTRNRFEKFRIKLKQVLSKVYSDDKETYDLVIKEIGPMLPDNIDINSCNEKVDKNSDIYDFCKKLSREDKLPALFFQFSTSKCEEIFLEFVKKLHSLDSDTSKYKIEKEVFNTDQLTKDDDEDVVINHTENTRFDYYSYKGEYCFIDKKSNFDVFQFEDAIHAIMSLKSFKKNEFNNFLIEGLRRGVGLYNDDLPLSYRILGKQFFFIFLIIKNDKKIQFKRLSFKKESKLSYQTSLFLWVIFFTQHFFELNINR